MSADSLLQFGTALGSVVCVWFALVGWKLLPLARAGHAPPTETHAPGP
jgi:hypothetical protein